jgi:AcrR family transcriptional regulator
MVRSAVALVSARGVHGVGLREIVAQAGGPRGSLQRYFPGGKAQLVTEALDLAGAELSVQVDSLLVGARTMAEAIEAIVAPWRRLLVDGGFTLGCPIAATVVDACDNDQLRERARALLTGWHGSVRDTLIRFGTDTSTADDRAFVLLAAVQGAVILARAQRSTLPLDTVQHFLATSFAQAAATPTAHGKRRSPPGGRDAARGASPERGQGSGRGGGGA